MKHKIMVEGRSKWKTIIQNSSFYLIATDPRVTRRRLYHEFAPVPLIILNGTPHG